MKIKFNLLKNIIITFLSIFFLLLVFLILAYLYILPNLVKSDFAINKVQKIVKEQLNLDLSVTKPKLETSFNPEIEFDVEKLILSKNNEILVDLNDFEIEISFEDIFNKTIKLKELEAKKLIVKVDKIISAFPQSDKKTETKPIDLKFNLIEADIELDYFMASFLQNKTLVELFVKNSKLENRNFIFESSVDIYKNNQKLVQILTKSNDEIKFCDDKIQISNLKFLINKSRLKVNSDIYVDKITANVKSDVFYLADVFDLINSDLFIPQGSAMLLPINSPKGNVNFDINMNNLDLSGIIDVNNTGIKIKDVSNLPISVTDGKIKISKDKIDFINLIGYYGKNKSNKLKISGDIKDYYKTFDSNIVIESIITNEFFKDYLSKLINNSVLMVSKPSPTKIIYKSKNNIMDIIWFAQISKGVNFGLSDEKSALSDYDRAVLGEFQISGNKLEIKNLNYYIAANIVRGVKLQPILTLNGLMDLTGKIDRIGFVFGRELPCEFLNIFVKQKMFKKGTIKGNLAVEFVNDIPYLDADMQIKNTFIPSQRLSLREMALKTNNNLINLNAKGRFKRAKYDFKGSIKNGLEPPFTIKNLALDIDNLDVERILASFNNQKTSNTNDVENIEISSEDDIQDDNYMFDTSLVRIEDCDFTLQKGNYKDIKFGNIKAKLTLDEKGILKVNSNKFDIAEGSSSLKVICDLQKLKYYIRLGIKGIDSNLMAKTLFNLDREITGAAYGLIELSGDKTLKLNGDIKFLINDGTIGKIGLVEYLMKIASVFRNPIVMVSPATIMDIVSIPEGKFDKIEGVIKIKDNVLSMINIKSYSKTLSALIRGKFDLDRHDASLRIYTRFSTDKKSMFGVLRNLSLNSLANKVKFTSRNDANYYASELVDLPQIEVEESKTQVFLTQVEGDIEHYNFLSSLKKIK